MTRLDRRCWLEDAPIGGWPPGSDGAKAAIARVGRQINGNQWRPAGQVVPRSHKAAEKPFVAGAGMRCEFCGEWCVRNKAGQKYCSDACDNAAWVRRQVGAA